MYVDGDDTETPETTALLISKLRDHANRAGFKRRAAKVANAYKQYLQNYF